MAEEKKVYVYPEMPPKQLQMTEKWMEAYMANEGTDKQVEDYIAYLSENPEATFNQRRSKFCEIYSITFTKKEKTKAQKHQDRVAEILKKRQANK